MYLKAPRHNPPEEILSFPALILESLAMLENFRWIGKDDVVERLAGGLKPSEKY